MTKPNWEKEFNELGFGNQAVISGTKRVELLDFIRKVEKEAEERGVRKATNTIIDNPTLLKDLGDIHNIVRLLTKLQLLTKTNDSK